MGWLDEMRVADLPEGRHGDVAVERFTVEEGSLANLHEALRGRQTRPGEYTMLTRGGRLWMSDTDAELRDHVGAYVEVRARGGRVLLGGLGLGCILRAALRAEGVEHVDVVEVDADVLALVGPHYEAMAAAAGKSLALHHADVYEVRWPPGTRWDVAWFDVWPDLCTDNLAGMARLRRSYGRRTGWNDCWGRHLLLREREHERRQPWWR